MKSVVDDVSNSNVAKVLYLDVPLPVKVFGVPKCHLYIVFVVGAIGLVGLMLIQ